MTTYSKVLMFGVFDGLHDGHRHVLSQAQDFKHIVVVVTPDDVVYRLKGKYPHISLEKRMEKLASEYPNLSIISGDREIGSWAVLDKEQPTHILLGYDQEFLGTVLKKYIVDTGKHITILTATSYEPTVYHSRFLNKK